MSTYSATIHDQTVTLGPTQEQHWGPIWMLREGDTLDLSGEGTTPFYLGLFGEEEYLRQKAAFPGRWPFIFGTARSTFFRRYVARGPGKAYIVLRVGTFDRVGTIRVLLNRVIP